MELEVLEGFYVCGPRLNLNILAREDAMTNHDPCISRGLQLFCSGWGTAGISYWKNVSGMANAGNKKSNTIRRTTPSFVRFVAILPDIRCYWQPSTLPTVRHFAL
jgi:hypothetical protein